MCPSFDSFAKREASLAIHLEKRGLFASNCRSSSSDLIVLQTAAPFSAGNQAHLIQFVCEARDSQTTTTATREFSFLFVCSLATGKLHSAYPYVHN
jgi:hypothetical protein